MEKFVVDVENNQISNAVPLSQFMQQNAPTGQADWQLVDYGFLLLVLAAGLFILSRLVFLVREKSVVVIERFGKFNRIAKAGLRFRIPFIDQIAGRVSLQIDQLSENIQIKSADNVFMIMPVKVQYQVIDESVFEAFYQLENPAKQVSSYITNTVRSTATGKSMEELFQSKNSIELAVTESLNEKFSKYGYRIINVLVDNPMPSSEVTESFDRVISSKRLKEAASNEAEAIRIKTVANAQAEAESLTLKADAYVKQRKVIAEGMEGIIGKEELANYLIGIDWRDTIRDAGNKGGVIVVPVGGEVMGNLTAALKASNGMAKD